MSLGAGQQSIGNKAPKTKKAPDLVKLNKVSGPL